MKKWLRGMLLIGFTMVAVGWSSADNANDAKNTVQALSVQSQRHQNERNRGYRNADRKYRGDSDDIKRSQGDVI